jgi:hypothetical protein
MRRHVPGSTVVLRASLFLSVLTFLAIGSRAAAGIGIPKKVKDAVGKSAEQKAPAEANATAPDEPVVFDEVVLELTEERVQGILTAFERAEKASAGRPALVAKVEKANEERGKIDEKHGERIREDQRRRSEIEVCYHDGYQAAQDRKTQEYQQKALTDPAIREKFAKVAMEQNAAAAAGDTAAIQKINAVLYSEILPSKEDSAAVRKGCGSMPSPSAEEKKLDALDKELSSLNEQIRKIDDQVSKEQGGLNPQQWGMALERIQTFLSAKKQKPSDSPMRFSEEELKAMEKHLEDLKSALGWQ